MPDLLFPSPARALYRGTRSALAELREEYAAPTLSGLSTLLVLSDLERRAEGLEARVLTDHDPTRSAWAHLLLLGVVESGLALLERHFPGFDASVGQMPEEVQAVLTPAWRRALLACIEQAQAALDAWAKSEEVTP